MEFNTTCKACEQIERNEKKNTDRPRAIFDQRVASWATKLGVPKQFLLVQMNWTALLPEFRAAMQGAASCQSCGHGFVNERDIQLEHREPPRSGTDWARHHARNMGVYCQSCNGTKGKKPYTQWLDEQEEARMSNEIHRHNSEPCPTQAEMFT